MPPASRRSPKIGLVLGSGSARGWAHLERVHDLLMGVWARLRAVCVVANPRNSQAIAVVCASQPIPNRIPHTFIRDHEHVLRTCSRSPHGCAVAASGGLRRCKSSP